MGKQAVITVAVTDRKVRDKLSAENCRIGGWKEGFDPFYGAPAVLIERDEENDAGGSFPWAGEHLDPQGKGGI